MEKHGGPFSDAESEKAQDVTSAESRHDPMSIPQLDGRSDLTMVDAHAGDPQLATFSETMSSSNCENDLYASEWADDRKEASPSPTPCPSTPDVEHSAIEDDILPDSPKSTDSHGKWLYPPRRIQYIGAFIEPCATLTQEVRAALWLWKAASKAQIYSEQHMEKVRYNNYLSSEQKRQQAKEFQIEIDDYGEEEIRQYEELAGFSKKACYGNVLSEMVRRVENH